MNMNAAQFMLMRNEVLLSILLLVILVAEMTAVKKNRGGVIAISMIGFFLITLAGFLPLEEGNLFGGMFQTSRTTQFMKNILNIGLCIVFLQSVKWLQNETNEGKVSEFFMLILSTLIGMNFMISSGDFLILYIGLELATIPIAALAAFDRFSNKSAEAGIKLILSSALSSGILLFGISMIYGTTGSILFSEIAGKVEPTSLQTLGLIFFVSGMGFKISLVPFHLWTADVYEGSPVSVTSYLSVISKGAAVFALIFVLYKVFTSVVNLWEPLLYTLAVSTMTIGNLFAIRQNNMKRFLAFSSIAQAGFILLGIMGTDARGMATVIYFVFIYVFTNLAAFGVVMAISNYAGKENISDYTGLYRTNPKLSLVLLLAMFSLAGIPPVAGFFGKFFLFTSAASQGYYILVLIAVINATISLYYYLRVVKAMFIDKIETPIPYFKSDLPMRISLLISVLGIFFIGFAGFIYEYIVSISFGV
jgi:NADH-quinone oxidoreductase subunit N